MTAVDHAHDHHTAPPVTGFRRLTAPGWLRVLWVTPIGFGIGIGLPCLIRWLVSWGPVWKGSVLVTVELVTTPLVLPDRPRRLRLLGALLVRPPDTRPRTTRGTAPSRGATTSA